MSYAEADVVSRQYHMQVIKALVEEREQLKRLLAEAREQLAAEAS